MIDGGEITVTKVKDVEKVLPPVGPMDTAPPLVKTQAKVGKANLKEKENLLALPWATAAPNPAATVGKLDMSIETVANDCGMKNIANKKRNPHTIITPNMRLTFRWMRPP
jgi:hypothetical protein